MPRAPVARLRYHVGVDIARVLRVVQYVGATVALLGFAYVTAFSVALLATGAVGHGLLWLVLGGGGIRLSLTLYARR